MDVCEAGTIPISSRSRSFVVQWSSQSSQTTVSWTCRHLYFHTYDEVLRWLESQRRPVFRIEQLNDGNVGPCELEESFGVDRGQVLGDPNGGQQSRALIRDLDKERREHLFLSTFIFHRADVPLAVQLKLQCGRLRCPISEGQSCCTVRQFPARNLNRAEGSCNRPQRPPRAARALENLQIIHFSTSASSLSSPQSRCRFHNSCPDCASITPHTILPRPPGHLSQSCPLSTSRTSARISRMPPWPG